MFVIEGPIWFVAALVICGWHALYICGWRRELRQHTAWWKKYDADAQKRHDAFMSVMKSTDDGTVEEGGST